MNQQPLERTVVKNGLRLLNKLPKTYARKVHGDGLQSGWPDLVGCCQGRMLALEAKRPGAAHTVTKLQRLELDKWQHTGAITGVFTNNDDIVAILLNSGVFGWKDVEPLL